MNKEQLISVVAEKAGIPKTKAKAAIEAFTDVVRVAVATEDSISLHGFGTFEAVTRAARDWKNPATGESKRVEQYKAPHFKPAKAFKDMLKK